MERGIDNLRTGSFLTYKCHPQRQSMIAAGQETGLCRITILTTAITLPLGPALGGPLFFEHYSFLGINPTGLTDVYANYQTQTTNHTQNKLRIL